LARCALLDHLPTLHGHLAPMLLRRQRRGLLTDVAWTAGNLLASVVTPLQILFALRDAGRLIQSRAAEQEILRQINTNVAVAQADHTRGLASAALEAFATVLSPDENALPVILLLDDAQWIDPVSLEFVWRLFARAAAGHWPLLVIATHWEQEWRLADAAPPDSPPRRLADLPRLPEVIANQRDWKPIVVEPVADLSEILTTALPGLSAAQSRLILDKSGGNPQLLEEIIRWLLTDERLFDAGRFDRALTPDAETDLRQARFDRHDLFARRFARLGRQVRQALGWSSVQGLRFLTTVTRDAAWAVDPSLSHAALSAALKEGESPHALIRLRPGDENLGQFRQSAFRQVALQHLAVNRAELAAVEAAVKRTLSAWVETGQIDQLPSEERLDALEMASRHLRPDSDSADAPSWRRWTGVMTRLMAHYRSNLLWDQCFQAADELSAACPGGWSAERLDQSGQLDLIESLVDGARLDAAWPHAQALRRQVTVGAAWQVRAAAAWWCGEILLQRLNIAEARTHYREALGAADEGIRSDAMSVRDWSNVGWCLVRLAHLSQEQNLPDTARAYSQALVDYAATMRRAGLNEHTVLRFESVGVSGLALVAEQSGDFTSAETMYRRAIELHGQAMRIEPSNHHALRSMAIDANRLAHVLRRIGRVDDALPIIQQSVEARRALLAQLGRTPDAVGDLAFGLADGAMILLAAPSQRRLANTMLLDAAEALWGLDRAGQLKPLHARYLGVVLRTLGDLAGGAPAAQTSAPLYHHALKYFVRAAEAAPDSPPELTNLATIAERLAQCEQAVGNLRSAVTGHLQAIALYRKVADSTNRNADALRRLASALLGAAEALLSAQQAPAAAPLAQESADIYAEVLRLTASDDDRTALVRARQIATLKGTGA
jgi:tetratricopeptide (TPR) repeat protein